MNIYNMLKETNYDVSEGSFPESNPPNYPFIIFEAPYSNNFCADNKVLKDIDVINVRLYNSGKICDKNAYRNLCSVLNNHDIPYQKISAMYINEESHFETIIEFEHEFTEE